MNLSFAVKTRCIKSINGRWCFGITTAVKRKLCILTFQSSSTACAYAVVLHWHMKYIFSNT